ncbi:MAG: nuclear transport factor 2 family protein [Myxococcaceae bacterium]
MTASPKAVNEAIAHAWLEAFNRYDVDALVALYADDATHTSPKIRALHPDTGGKLVGRAALSSWWRESNARLPGLRYELTALTANEDRVFVEYIRHAPNQPDMPVAEVFDVRDGRIVASRVYHG